MDRLLISVAVLFLLGMPTFGSAATSHVVSPRVIDLEVAARDVTTRDISITNTGSGPVRVFASVNAIDLTDGGEIERFVSPAMSDRSNTITSWLEITRAQHELLPGESATVPLTVRMPPTVEPGNYHAFVGFGSGTNQIVAHNKVKQGVAPGVIVRVAVQDDLQSLLRLGQFTIDRFMGAVGSAELQYTLENPGDTELVPRGEVIFYNTRGAEVAAQPINPDKRAIAPGASITISDAVPDVGTLGRYKAYLNVEFGETQVASVQDTAFFYVMPWYILLISALLLLAIVVVIALYVYHNEDDDETDDEVPVFVRPADSTRPEKTHDLRITKV